MLEEDFNKRLLVTVWTCEQDARSVSLTFFLSNNLDFKGSINLNVNVVMCCDVLILNY